MSLNAPSNVRCSLGEGNTPLVDAVHCTSPGGKLLFKLESANPTGSYKDRFVSMEVQRMLEADIKFCVATSSGNTGSSLAAYCARAGIGCAIVVNQDVPEGKLQQMSAHGAHVLRVPGFVTDVDTTAQVFAALGELSKHGVPLVVSAFCYCPAGMLGVESIATELIAAQPDHVFVPVGGGGLFSAIVQGFQKHAGRVPRVHAVQPEGCLTLVGAYLAGTQTIPVPASSTRISGLSVPADLDASRALTLLHSCGGTGIVVRDEDVFAAQREMFLREGIYCEPAGATAFAGWKQATANGTVGSDEVSVCLVTGHGFKDPVSAQRIASSSPARLVTAVALQKEILDRLAGGHVRP